MKQSIADSQNQVIKRKRRKTLKTLIILTMVVAVGLGLFLGLFFGLKGPERVQRIQVVGMVYQSIFVDKRAPSEVKPYLTAEAYEQAKKIHDVYLQNETDAPLYSGDRDIRLGKSADLYIVLDSGFKKSAKFSSWDEDLFFVFENDLIKIIYYDSDPETI